MRGSGLGKVRLQDHLVRLEHFLGHLEQHQTERHIHNAIKEWLLASRSVIDSIIDTLEEEQGPPVARKIHISKEETDPGKGEERN